MKPSPTPGKPPPAPWKARQRAALSSGEGPAREAVQVAAAGPGRHAHTTFEATREGNSQEEVPRCGFLSLTEGGRTREAPRGSVSRDSAV